jgi:hypothetical protein
MAVRRRTQGFWMQEVTKRILTLRDRAIRRPDLANPEAVQQLVRQAEQLTEDFVPLFSFARLSEWWFGSRIERAWACLHEADFLIARNAGGHLFLEVFDEALGVSEQLDAQDPLRVRLNRYAAQYGLVDPPAGGTPVPAPDIDPRLTIEAVLRQAYGQSDSFHHDTRAFRNRLVVTTLISVLVALGLVVLQWRISSAAILAIPRDSSGLSRWAIFLLVMLFGSVGALVTTIPSMAAIPRVSGPFNFPLQQAILKIVLGSLTAVVGVIAIGNAGVTSGFASLESLLGVAVIFGAGQQAVTQFLDKRAGEIISSAK